MAIWQCAGPVGVALAPGMRKNSIQLSNVPAARPALRKEEPGIDCAIVGKHDDTGKHQACHGNGPSNDRYWEILIVRVNSRLCPLT
jgi:hypothetical protein